MDWGRLTLLSDLLLFNHTVKQFVPYIETSVARGSKKTGKEISRDILFSLDIYTIQKYYCMSMRILRIVHGSIGGTRD